MTSKLTKIAFLALLFCAFLNAQMQAQTSNKKVALTTFFVRRQIDMSELSVQAQKGAEMLKTVKDSAFNLEPMLNDFKKVFFEDYAKNFNFMLMPETSVLDNPDYKAYAEPVYDDAVHPVVPPGYKVMFPGFFLQKKEDRAQNEMLKIFPDADGVMFVFMSYGFFVKAAIGGTGAAGIRAYCHIWLYNKEGKVVFKVNEGATSKGSVGLVGGIPVMGVDKVLPLCKDATTRLLEDLKDRLPKMLKKAGEKL
ncbi:MAG: hypothetical protein KGS48_00225 [Bacteroidetes bacterium]|nr:hypothetical protein [Bacteroidota bacterium]